jgi:hypothetical protein
LPDGAVLAFSRIAGGFLKDVLITPEEIQGLKADLLFTVSPPTGTTCLTDWLRENPAWLGKQYMCELARRLPQRPHNIAPAKRYFPRELARPADLLISEFAPLCR